MKHPFLSILAGVVLTATIQAQDKTVTAARCLPDELSAEQVLNGEYPFPPSPKAEVSFNDIGLAHERLSKVPPAGVHPRVLISPEDLPDLRKRLKETDTGKALYATLQKRLDDTIRNPKEWGNQLYEKLAAGDQAGAQKLLDEHKGFPPAIGHYQPWVYAIVLESLDCLITEDAARGKKVAGALATYAQIIQPLVDKALAGPLGDDVWRAKTSGPATGSGDLDQGAKEAMGGHLMGYGYDFAYNFMTPAQRDTVRGLIARATSGELWMGARLPHHFRNWNWIAVGLSQPLLALSIEGETGYDERVYKLGVQIAQDYLAYGISQKGFSTEAVGYTQFGLVWANPFFVAVHRRSDQLLAQNHHRAMIDWYLHSMEPARDHWTSHGDGGDRGPEVWTLLMWRYFYPLDSKIDFLWQSYLKANGDKALTGNFHLIEPLLWASDGQKDREGKPLDYQDGAKLNLPLTWFSPIRSSLLARSAWNPDAALMEFECRTDSVGASHEHADRGAFTFSALGRVWAKDNFRSVETRHHNSILIDGMGQGYWPGPGEWLGLSEEGSLLMAACNMKDAYDYWWPKEIITEDPKTFNRFQFGRWSSYKTDAETFQKNYPGVPALKDERPSVQAHWKGFTAGDPRMWDEDGWPKKLPHNLVRRAFRSIVFSRGDKPWLLVVDDIQKDEKEHLYEWLMQTGPDTETVSLQDGEIILGDVTGKRNAEGNLKPEKGDRLLLVRVLEQGEPAGAHDYQARPSLRLETFERKDTLVPAARKEALSGSRSFGYDKRLVIPSRSVSPNFKILLFPFREGDPLPVTTWNADQSKLTLQVGDQKDEIAFTKEKDGRSRILVNRPGLSPVTLK
jgi:hypothetical protein